MQNEQLKTLIITRLTEITTLKGLELSEIHYKTWTNKIIKDYESGSIDDIQKGFENLEQEKSYGGLDYAVFLEGAKLDEIDNEDAWTNVLKSAKRGGTLSITTREAKALNSLGGMDWLRNANPEFTHVQKREFLNAYDLYTDESYPDEQISCYGLEAPILNKTSERTKLNA